MQTFQPFKYLNMKLFSSLFVVGAIGVAVSTSAQETLYVDAGSRGHDINPDMYGIFFEEINHSGDGGLYAELIQNRGFEEQTIPGGFSISGTNKISTPSFKAYTDLSTRQLNWDWDFDRKKMTGWRVEGSDCRVEYDVVTPQEPLHEATPNACASIWKMRATTLPPGSSIPATGASRWRRGRNTISVFM